MNYLCNDEIKVYGTNLYYPRGCYFNNYYEESDEYKKMYDERYNASLFWCEIED